MVNIVMLFLCLAIGIVLQITRRVPENAHLAINAFIIHVALPALIIEQIHKIPMSAAVMTAAFMPWLLFGLSALVFFGTRRLLGISLATTGALTLSAGLANTSFVGLPMIETFYGPQGLSIGILIDQLGTYLVLSTLGIATACLCSGNTTSKREIALRIVRFPPFIALLIAVALAGLDYPLWVTSVLHRLGDTLAPLALVSVGLQLRFNEIRGNRISLTCGLMFKLIAGPAIVALVYIGLLRQSGESTQITLFEAAMGPQIGGAIVAIQYGLNPALITLMVGLGITASFLTLPIWWFFLRAI